MKAIDIFLLNIIQPWMLGMAHLRQNRRVEELRKRVVEGSVLGSIFTLAGPIAAARLLGSIQESVDAIFLGRVGTEDLAVPAAASTIFWLFMGLNFGVSTALISLVSQHVGARRFDEASRIAGQVWALSILLGCLGALALVVVAPLVYRLQGIPPGVYELAVAYITINSISLPFMFTMFFFNGLSGSMGDTRKPFIVSSISSLLNIILDPILIFGLGPFPRMEVIGAALATVVSRVVASGLALYMLLSGSVGLRVVPRKPGMGLVRVVARIGGPVALQRVAESAGFLFMMGIVARLGAAVIAAYNISLAILHVFQSITFGLNLSMATVVGQNLGAGLIERARSAAVKGASVVFLILSAGSALVYLARDHVVGAFTSIEEVAVVSTRMLEVVVLGMPFLGLYFLSNGVARGSGFTGLISLIGFSRLWLVRIPLAYTLVYTLSMGDLGVWWSMTLSNMIAGSLGMAWVLKGDWSRPIALKLLSEKGAEKQDKRLSPGEPSF